MKLENNKAQFAFTDFAAMFIALVLISLSIYMSFNVAYTQQKEFEIHTPQISHQFQKMFVLGYLNFPLDLNDSKTYFGNSRNSYVVKDLIWCNSESAIQLAQTKYKSRYLEEIRTDTNSKDALKLFKSFSGYDTLEESLIRIIPAKSALSDMSVHYEQNNSVFVIQTGENLFTWISFGSDDIIDKEVVNLNYLNKYKSNCLDSSKGSSEIKTTGLLV